MPLISPLRAMVDAAAATIFFRCFDLYLPPFFMLLADAAFSATLPGQLV